LNYRFSLIIGRWKAELKMVVNNQRESPKTFWGILLLFLTPVFLFVKPVSKAAVLPDLLLVIWWKTSGGRALIDNQIGCETGCTFPPVAVTVASSKSVTPRPTITGR
jgi:hypothetical protein